MERNANYFIVGLFVSIAFIATLGFVIWLAGMHGSGDYERFTIYFTDPVSGLAEEAPVKYKGVQVGKILAMRLSPSRSELVKVDIEIDKGTPVRSGTTAKIEGQGVTGTNYIELETASNDTNPPSRMPDEAYPVLKGSGSQLAKFLADVPNVTKQLLTTLSGINEVSRESASMIESIKAFAGKLHEDPSQILHPPAQKGVEIPK